MTPPLSPAIDQAIRRLRRGLTDFLQTPNTETGREMEAADADLRQTIRVALAEQNGCDAGCRWVASLERSDRGTGTLSPAVEAALQAFGTTAHVCGMDDNPPHLVWAVGQALAQVRASILAELATADHANTATLPAE